MSAKRLPLTCVALNAAVDQTVLCDNFNVDAVNRGQGMRLEAGGKGVNVAAFLASSGSDVAVTGFLGSDNAAIFEELFQRQGITDRMIRLPGATRTGVKIVDLVRGVTTDINLPGLAPSPQNVENLFAVLHAQATPGAWFVLSGSLPPGVAPDLYAQIIHLLRVSGCQTVLDTSGAALKQALKAGPTMLKPNLAELQEMVNLPLSPADLPGVVAAAKGLFCDGLERVVVSMGSKGALLVAPGQVLHAVPPAVTVCSTVGAGDALVAGLVGSLCRGMDLPACMRRAVAFSVACVTAEQRGLPDESVIAGLAEQVRVESL
jgi:1-phosphofructokinase